MAANQFSYSRRLRAVAQHGAGKHRGGDCDATALQEPARASQIPS
jgi:hypothetical protein